ncbi:hypothetical protein A4A49_04088 [Nicotiana attenuata]|uniref:Retrovirus-related Pol polyprotein from transposon TNT 1-94-like beta-barrel domain-containing protein n=1 Tax=Nicotiana attenuata TaxID=49451 RepID=A0A314LBD7_NICAT|nr:hypothetical protein A4A49_04088 [Nicotiana attenuata]
MFTQEQYDQILKPISTGTGENASFAGTSKTFVTNEKIKDENWIVDSGATNHMVHTRELLDKINTDFLGNAPKVYLPDETSLDVECTGESRIGENSTVKNILDVKFMEHIFPFQLLKEGNLQLFPNGVLHYPVTTDAVPVQINTHDADASLSAMPPVADNHTADTQPSSPLPLFSKDTPAQQSPPSE